MNPVVIEDKITIAASTVNNNVIVSNSSLRRYLRAPFPCKGKLVATRSADGLTVQFDHGSRNVVAESDVRTGTDMQEPLDVVNAEFYLDEGDIMVLRANNSTAGGIDLRYRIVLDPLAESGERVTLPPDHVVMQKGPISIGAGAVDTQLLDGLRYERAIVPSLVDFYLTGSAAGLTRQCFVENVNIAPPSAVPPLNRIPQVPFDLSVAGVEAEPDKKLELSTSNPTAGAISISWKQVLKQLLR